MGSTKPTSYIRANEVYTYPKTTFRDIKDQDYGVQDFEEGIIHIKQKSYEVYMAQGPDGVYFKPYKKYEQFEFEHILFGFTNHCENYDPNKIVLGVGLKIGIPQWD